MDGRTAVLAQGTGRERAVAGLRRLLDLALACFACSLGLGLLPAQIAFAAVLAAAVGLQLLGAGLLRPTAVDKPFVLLLLALGLGVLGQRAAGASLFHDELLGFYRLGAAVLLVGAIGTPARAATLAKIFVIAVSLQGLYGVVQHHTGLGGNPAPFSSDRWLAIGTYGSHLTHAFVTAAGLTFLSAALLTRALGRRAWVAVLLAIPAGLGTLFTLVRTAWGALAAAVGTMAVVGRRLQQGAALFAALALVGAATVALSPALRDKARLALDPALAENAPRAVAWARTLELVAAHPVTGIGAGTFASRAAASPGPAQPDNYLLYVWAAGGPLALLAFVWLVGAAIAALRRGAKALGPEQAEARAVILGSAGVVGLFLAWTVLQDPLHDGVIAWTLAFALALGLAASGRAASPTPFESLVETEPPEVVPADEAPPPARTSAAVAAGALACAAVGGIAHRGEVRVAEAVVALAILAVGAVGYLPLVPRAVGVSLRGLAVFAGAAVLAARPFAALLEPGSGAWWASPSAAVCLAALVAGSAGTAWSIRRPGLVGPAPVAGTLTAAWAALFVACLDHLVFPYLLGGYDPVPLVAYNFVVGACAVGMLFVAWAGPLGFGQAKVVGVAERLVHLPTVVVAGCLAILALSALG